ncbi:MAG: hypothetical protein LUE12_05350 [Ruminococcus sp.]|nr:hypothetical protein [Ruminococcus sp.]
MSTAIVMGVSMMSMGASAYSETINLHYVKSASSGSNSVTNSWTTYTTKPTQTMKITSVKKSSSSSTAKILVFNPMGIDGSTSSTATFTKTGVETGVKITLYAKLYNYSSLTYMYASGSVSG